MSGGIPRSELIWTAYCGKDGSELFLMTSKETRDRYFLYAMENGVWKKLGAAKSPPELEDRFRVFETIKGNIESKTKS